MPTVEQLRKKTLASAVVNAQQELEEYLKTPPPITRAEVLKWKAEKDKLEQAVKDAEAAQMKDAMKQKFLFSVL